MVIMKSSLYKLKDTSKKCESVVSLAKTSEFQYDSPCLEGEEGAK